MKKAIFTMVVVLAAVLIWPGQARALTNVFSMDAADWGGKIDIDASNKYKLTIEGRLVPSADYTSLPKFSAEWDGTEAGWTSGHGAEMQNEKIDFVLQSIIPPGAHEIGVNCEVVEEGSGSKGDKFRCTQISALPLPAGVNASNVDLATQYLFVWPINGYALTSTTNAFYGWPLNLGTLLARGLSTDSGGDGDGDGDGGDGEECDVTDTTLDCDGDGLLNGVDECVSEYGEGEDGCPLSGDISGEGGVQPIGDGGGCSTIAPAAAPNASAFLMMALALMPLVIRRRR